MNPLLPFIMAGDPSLESLPHLLSEAKALGIEALEIGLPHSDPIADGPVLQAAAHRAIQRGATPLRVLETLAGLTESPDLILFTYLNPLLQIGADRLMELLRPTPVKALLVVDLPDSEEVEFEARLRSAGYPMIPLLSPTTDLERAKGLLERSAPIRDPTPPLPSASPTSWRAWASPAPAAPRTSSPLESAWRPCKPFQAGLWRWALDSVIPRPWRPCGPWAPRPSSAAPWCRPWPLGKDSDHS